MRTHAQEIVIRYSLPNGQPRTIAIAVAGESVFISEVRGTYRVLKRTL